MQQLWGLTTDRAKVYERVRRDIDTQAQEDMEQLIPTIAFQQTMPFVNRVGKDKDIYKNIFRELAASNGCSLDWLGDGLQIFADDWSRLQETYQLLLPAVSLLKGTSANIYWADGGIVGLQFRFTKLARAVDQSVYRIKGFAANHYDLHLVYWDRRSRQFLTLRPKSIGQIEFDQGMRNPWHKHIEFQYGNSMNAPSQWMDVDVLSANLATNFIPPDQLSKIRSWVKDIDGDTLGKGQSTAEGSEVKLIPKEAEKNRVGLFAKGKRVENNENDTLAEQMKKNDTRVQGLFLEDDQLDKPRANPAPRLRAGLQVKSVEESMQSVASKQCRSDFMDILVHAVVKMVTIAKLCTRSGSSCIISFGQIFISSLGFAEEYQPRNRGAAAPFKPEDWRKIFGQDDNVSAAGKTFFSRKLTSSDDDALFMSLTQLQSNGERKVPQLVFQPKPESDITFYKIRCQNVATGTIGIIEIDQRLVTSIKAEAREIGFANIHFSAFWWDARASTCVTPILSAVDTAAFKLLLSTIWIGDIGTEADQGVRIFARLHPDMRILGCQRIRERIHRTTEDLPANGSIYLHINRIEDLSLANISSYPGGFCAFPTSSTPLVVAPASTITARSGSASATATIESSSSRDQRIWYEAHIHSEGINSILPRSSDPSAYPPGLGGPDHTFIPPEENEVLRQFIHEDMIRVFNATHTLVTQWDAIGSRDRTMGATRMRAESGGNDGATGILGSNTSVATADWERRQV